MQQKTGRSLKYYSHHVFNKLGEILKPPLTANTASIVGGKNAPGERRLSFISFWVIDLLLCDASKGAAFHRFCALNF
jgi:hypothetical protein